MDNFSSEVSDFTLFEQLGRTIFETLNVMKIGIIDSADWDNQEVDVKIAMKKQIPIKDGFELQEESLLVKVPFLCLGGGDSYLSFPVKQGDECLVIFSDFAIQNWRSTGQFLPPNELRKHDLCDGIAIIGIRNVNRLIKNYSQFVKLFMSDRSFMEVRDDGIYLESISNIDLVTTGNTSETADGTGVNVVADHTSISKDVFIGNDTDIGNDLLVEHDTEVMNDTTIDNNLTVHNNTQIDKLLNVDDDVTFTKNLKTTLNTDSGTYSTAGTPGITGVFVNAAGVKLIFTNGLITAVE